MTVVVVVHSELGVEDDEDEIKDDGRGKEEEEDFTVSAGGYMTGAAEPGIGTW